MTGGSGHECKVPDELARAVACAQRITVLTGAGVSAESGVPTFRDAQTGLWEHFKAEELATPDAFRRNPKLVWEWYAWRRSLIASAAPNPGHRALADLERELEQRDQDFTLVTQNVDGLHRLAGSRNVIELHGNISRTKCFDENVPVETWDATEELPPRCLRCGGLLRPDVVWFHEPLPAEALATATRAAQGCEVFISVGTAGLVYPAAGLPLLARSAGALLVEINVDSTPLTTQASFALRGPASKVLPALVSAVRLAAGPAVERPPSSGAAIGPETR